MKARQQSAAMPDEGASLPLPIGRRIAAQMHRRNLGAEALAVRIGVETPEIERIVRGEIVPTIDLTLKIANALDVRPGSLVSYGYATDFALSRAAAGLHLASPDGGCVSRALSPFKCGSPFEFYGVELKAGSCQRYDAYPPGTFETLTVHEGEIEIEMGREPPRRLETGDWLQFLADVPHSYRNVGGNPANLYLVVAYQRATVG